MRRPSIRAAIVLAAAALPLATVTALDAREASHGPTTREVRDSAPATRHGTSWRNPVVEPVAKVQGIPGSAQLLRVSVAVRPESARAARRLRVCTLYVRDALGRRWAQADWVPLEAATAKSNEGCRPDDDPTLPPERWSTVVTYVVVDRDARRPLEVDVEVPMRGETMLLRLGAAHVRD